MTHTYAIYSDDGQAITTGIQSEITARRTAQSIADEIGQTVYFDTVPTGTDPDDDEDCGEAVHPTR